MIIHVKSIDFRMKLSLILLLIILTAGNCGFAQIIEKDHWNLRTTFGLESAFKTASLAFQKSELLINPEFNADLPHGIRLRGVGRLRSDAFDQLEPGQPAQFELSDIDKRTYIGDHIDLELREFFIDFFIGPLYLKAGKQQIVWGKTDGLKLLDVINPQNFREFVLDKFEDSRIPLWSFKTEISVGDIWIQFIWIPDKTYHKLPVNGADFSFTAPEFSITVPDGFEATINPINRPDDFLTDSDVGIRLSTFWKGWDLTLNYLYHYYDVPVVSRTVQFEPVQRVVINQHYRRSHLAGTTFSNAFGNITIRGETAFSFDRYFRTVEQSDSDGIKKGNTFDYAIGLDWFGFDDMLVSGQLFQHWLLMNKVESVFNDRVSTRISLLIKRSFMNERLELEMLTVAGINEADGFTQPKAIYEWKNNINVWVGFDGFWGDREDLLGQFNQQDRIIFGMEVGL